MKHRKLPSLVGLRAFEAAARLGRMSLAADELCVTPGAISRSIRHLEMEIGTTLFCGPKHALRLTPRGASLANDLSLSFRHLETAVEPYFNEDSGPVYVSCLSTFAMRWLIPRLAGVQLSAPQVSIELSTSDRAINFQRETYDLAIRITDNPIPEDALISELFPEYVGLVGSPELFNKHHNLDMTPSESIPVLDVLSRPHLIDFWAQQNNTQSPAIACRFEHFGYAIEAAKAGLGVCIAPWPLVMDDLRSEQLLAPLGFIASGYSYIAARRNIRSRKVEKLCECILSEAQKTPQPSHRRA